MNDLFRRFKRFRLTVRSIDIQRLQETIWLLIALVTPLFVNLWVEQQFEASKVWMMRTLVWVLAVLWVGGLVTGYQLRPLPSPITKVLIAIVLVLLLSTNLSTNPYIAINGTLDRANGVVTQMSYFLLYLCVVTQIDRQRSQLLLRVLALTAVPICLIGLAQAVGWQPLPVFTDARSLLTTTLGRSNFTGAYLALLLPLIVTTAQSVDATWQRIGYGVFIMLVLIVIVLTQARAAWVSAVAGLSVLWWLQVAPGWSRRIRWFSALAGLLGFAGGLVLIFQHAIVNGGSLAARWTIWQASLSLLWPRLWTGYGADTLEIHFPSVYPPELVYYQGRGVIVDRAHNWLLDWSLNYGVVATILLTVLIYFILRQVWYRLISGKKAMVHVSEVQRQEIPWLAGCAASLCAHLIGNLFLFEVAATAIVFWLILAIVTAETLPPATKAVQFAVPSWIRNVVMAGSCVVLIWAVWQSNLRPLIADAHIWRGTRALNQSNPQIALAEYQTAVEHQPQRAEYHVALALTAAQIGYFEQADGAMRAAIALRPTDPLLYTQLAAIYASEASASPEKLEMAYWAYERATLIAPTIGLTYQQYADFALRSGNWASALLLAQQAVELDATDGVSFGILGWAQLQDDNLEAAQDAFEQAVKWVPDSADFHFGLATVYIQQGNFDAAREALQRSVILDPTYQQDLRNLLQLELNR